MLAEWQEWLAGGGPIEVIPAVDVLGEGAVRLHQGAYDAVVVPRLQASGGIRSLSDARALLEAGADRVVVGTAAFPDPAPWAVLGEQLVVALDVRDGQVRTAGWTEGSGLTVDEAAR